MATGRFVSYLRVSTQEQGRSGLGIEAQREAVTRHLNGGSWELVAEFVEIESGKKNDRPKLQEALNHCKLTGSKLIISRLDRLSRNAAFITALQDSKLSFVCCDMPEANEFTITIMAALAQQERNLISKRTKEALAARKARGLSLGTPANMTDEARVKGCAASAKSRKQSSDERAALLDGRIKQMIGEGMSLRAIAKRFEEEKIETPRKGGVWHANTVKRLIS